MESSVPIEFLHISQLPFRLDTSFENLHKKLKTCKSTDIFIQLKINHPEDGIYFPCQRSKTTSVPMSLNVVATENTQYPVQKLYFIYTTHYSFNISFNWQARGGGAINISPSSFIKLENIFNQGKISVWLGDVYAYRITSNLYIFLATGFTFPLLDVLCSGSNSDCNEIDTVLAYGIAWNSTDLLFRTFGFCTSRVNVFYHAKFSSKDYCDFLYPETGRHLFRNVRGGNSFCTYVIPCPYRDRPSLVLPVYIACKAAFFSLYIPFVEIFCCSNPTVFDSWSGIVGSFSCLVVNDLFGDNVGVVIPRDLMIIRFTMNVTASPSDLHCCDCPMDMYKWILSLHDSNDCHEMCGVAEKCGAYVTVSYYEHFTMEITVLNPSYELCRNLNYILPQMHGLDFYGGVPALPYLCFSWPPECV